MNRIVPEVRIRRFNEDWEERNLEEVITVVGGATPSKSNPKYWNGPIVWLSSKEIKEKYVSEGTHTITKKAVDDNTTKIIKSGTPLIVSRSGILARLFPISIPTKDVAINQDIKALIFDNNIINTNFFVAQLQKNEKYILKSIVKTGTTVQSVNMPDFYKLKLFLPSKEEQEKTGNFFQVLDEIITLQQQLLNDHKKLKKSMLQKMFPQKGETLPKVRFSQFTSDWEQNKLSDFLIEFSRKSKSENQYIVLSSTTNGIEIRNGRVSGKSNLGYKILKRGEIVLSPQNLWMGNINYNNQFDIGLVSPSYKIFNIKNIEEKYLAYYLRLPKMMYAYEQASVQGASVVRRNLDNELFEQILVNVPIKEEQIKVTHFFEQLDETIDLHQKKLETYQELKKAMLQKMFV